MTLLPLLFALQAAQAGEAPPPAVAARADAAEASWKAGHLADAERGFVEVTDAAPGWDRGWRRRCGVVLADARPREAVTLCRKAVELDPSAENRTALAIALLRPTEEEEPAGRVELIEAGALLQAVVQERPDFAEAWPPLCDWSIAASEIGVLERCVGHLTATRPTEAGTLYFGAVLALQQQDVAGARKRLVAARTEGLADGLYKPLAAAIAEAGGPTLDDDAPRNGGARRAGEVAKGAFDPSRPDAVQGVSDWLPVAVGVGMVLAMGVLAFLGGRGGDSPPQPLRPDAAPPAGGAPGPGAARQGPGDADRGPGDAEQGAQAQVTEPPAAS
jgi:hypothetical protein